eukprot:scaffold180_cov311-Pinguiococcus_pyrenoidosus.AAC.26
MEPPRSLFYFRQRSGQIDWRRLGVVDVNRIVRQGDISELQEVRLELPPPGGPVSWRLATEAEAGIADLPIST